MKIKGIYYPQIEVVGHISNSMARFTEELGKDYKAPRDWVKPIREKIKEAIHHLDDDNSFPILPQRIVSDVRKVLPDDGIVCLDNGMFKL